MKKLKKLLLAAAASLTLLLTAAPPASAYTPVWRSPYTFWQYQGGHAEQAQFLEVYAPTPGSGLPCAINGEDYWVQDNQSGIEKVYLQSIKLWVQYDSSGPWYLAAEKPSLPNIFQMGADNEVGPLATNIADYRANHNDLYHTQVTYKLYRGGNWSDLEYANSFDRLGPNDC